MPLILMYFIGLLFHNIDIWFVNLFLISLYMHNVTGSFVWICLSSIPNWSVVSHYMPSWIIHISLQTYNVAESLICMPSSCTILPDWLLVLDYLIGWFSPLIIIYINCRMIGLFPLIVLSDLFQTIWLVDFHPSLYMRIACRIIGLYASLVYLIGRLFRTMLFSGQMYRVMFEELPYVDRILALCKDIYLVRECQNWRLEEDLFAKLIFLFRSPDMLFRWTKMKYD